MRKTRKYLAVTPVNFCLQKRAARIVLNVEKTTFPVCLFVALNWVPFYAESYVNRFPLTYNSNTPENLTPHRYCNLDLSCPRYQRRTEADVTFTFRVVSFAAARAGVTQCSSPLRGGGQHCVTPVRVAAKETTVRAIQE